MTLLLDYRPALRDRTGVGEWVHQLALNLLALKAEGDPAAVADRSDALEFVLARPACPVGAPRVERRHVRRPPGPRRSPDLGLEPRWAGPRSRP